MDYERQDAREARRHVALQRAVELTGHQQVKNFNAELTVNVAQRFDEYLRDGR